MGAMQQMAARGGKQWPTASCRRRVPEPAGTMMWLRQAMTGRVRAAIVVVAACGVAAGCGRSGPAPDTTAGAAAPDTSVGVDASRDTTGRDGAAVETTVVSTSARPANPASVALDTIRGVVAEVGSQPMTSVIVQQGAGRAVTIRGELAREIARAAGAEVWVRGRRDQQALEATAYAVRRVDGEPALDGILAREGDRVVLVTPTGRHPIARPLQAFRGMIGARVWLVGPVDGTISSYGVLRDP